jgi:hypothetical protein
MEELIDDRTFGNVYEVKTVLASVAAALAVYQLVLIAVGYGKLRPRFLGSPAASLTHRASGDVIVVLVVVGCRAARRSCAEDRRHPVVARPRAVPPGARDLRVRAARADVADVGGPLPRRG